ncbi:HD-GYP domain-containing protein [Bacillus massiliigorillae]|uniref:HD-GYP domain-containing protein n=1 Tax=Bacillus massiliigorillae TaxID=1243664 RepID=UPI0003AA27C2|nr:HD-GYP domain-containing protein [Bacillus massiliigorillae]
MSHNNEFSLEKKITPLTHEEIDQLLLNYQDEDYVMPPFEPNLVDNIIRSETSKIEEISRNVEEATLQMSEIFKFVKNRDEIPIAEIKEEIVPMIEMATDIPHVFHLFDELQQKDEYTFRHNICVGVIAGLISKWLGISEEIRREIELAGLLHDIGKTKVPQYLLHKKTPLNDVEFQQIKKHTLYGYGLLRRTKHLPEGVAITALQHHERVDGCGYPFRLNGSQIHPYAKIVAVADVFHALSSERAYRPAMPFYQVIMKMQDEASGRFDTEVLIVFITKMLDSLIGKKVKLTDGNVGTVILNSPYHPICSLIKLEDNQIVDLQKNRHLQIVRVLRE